MENLKIAPTKLTPEISFNAEKHILPEQNHNLGRTLQDLEANYTIQANAAVNLKSPTINRLMVILMLLGPICGVLCFAPFFIDLYAHFGENLPKPTFVLFKLYRSFVSALPLSGLFAIALAYFTTIGINRLKYKNFYHVFFSPCFQDNCKVMWSL